MRKLFAWRSYWIFSTNSHRNFRMNVGKWHKKISRFIKTVLDVDVVEFGEEFSMLLYCTRYCCCVYFCWKLFISPRCHDAMLLLMMLALSEFLLLQFQIFIILVFGGNFKNKFNLKWKTIKLINSLRFEWKIHYHVAPFGAIKLISILLFHALKNKNLEKECRFVVVRTN
jgi:hypothetical protein